MRRRRVLQSIRCSLALNSASTVTHVILQESRKQGGEADLKGTAIATTSLGCQPCTDASVDVNDNSGANIDDQITIVNDI